MWRLHSEVCRVARKRSSFLMRTLCVLQGNEIHALNTKLTSATMLACRVLPRWLPVSSTRVISTRPAGLSNSVGLRDVPAGHIIPPRTARFDDSLFDVDATQARLTQQRQQADSELAQADADSAEPSDGQDASTESPQQTRYYDGSEAVDSELWRSSARKLDRDGALAASFLPQEAAEAMFVIRTLNGEVSRVIDAARGNASAAALRFTFWRDLVTRAAAGRGHPHPISVPLGVVMARFDLTERYFHRLIDARAEDAMMRAESSSSPNVEEQEAGLDVPMTAGQTSGVYRAQTIEDVEEYADATEGSLGLLALETLGIRDSAEAAAAAGYVGRAVVIANLLRGLRVHSALGQVYLPAEVTDAHELSPGDIYGVFRRVAQEREKLSRAKEAGVTVRGGGGPERGNNVVGSSGEAASTHERLQAACYDFAVAGYDNLRAARELSGHLPKNAPAALLTAVPATSWYDHFQRLQFDPCHPNLVPAGQLSVIARMGWCWVRGTF